MTRCCVAHFPSLDKLTSGFQVHLNICTTVTAGMPAMDKRRQRLRCGGRLLLFHCVLAVISPAKAREVTSDPMFRPFNSIDRARACDSAGSFADAAYCNMSLSIDERMEDLLVRLTQEEKISLLVNAAPGIPHQALPAYEWWSEALHGVGLSPGVTFAPPTPTATSFPQVVTTSQSFNPALMQAIGASISTEGRAFNNVGHAGNTYWAPNINVFRDPRWGRGQETPGEDPFLSGVYAASFVRGMQEGEDPRYLKTSACCKHFAAYSVENLYNGTHRHNFDARVTPQDMADTYLPAFEACVKEGRASALMCSYNAINGVPACADAELLNALARGSWGFDGYITSDCGAIADIWTRHNYTNTPEEACQVALEAGCDLDCSTFYQEHCPHALSQGLVTDADVDTALSHLFRVQFRLGMFDAEEGQIYTKYGLERLNTPEHQELALEAARQGIVLLKNQGPVLPLPRPGLTNEQGGEHLPAAPLGADAWTSTFLRHHRRVEAPPEGPLPARESVSLVAVVGPHANGTQALLGNYRGIPPYIVSPIEGIRAYVPDALFAPGCGINSSSEQAFADAESAVSSAHVTVLILGLDVSIEDEGKDRTSLELPAPQVELAGRVLDAAVGRPVVVVLVGGGAVDVDFLARDDRVAAMLFAGYPGQAGGQALAEILFGDVNPSGRLTQTFYPASFVTQADAGDMRMRPDHSDGFPGRTYRFYDGPTVFPFGHGLSYTSFEIEAIACPEGERDRPHYEGYDVVGNRGTGGREAAIYLTNARPHDSRVMSRICVRVKNTGSRVGRATLIGFLRPPYGVGLDAPRRSLRAFGSISLAAQQEAVAIVQVTEADISLADTAGMFHRVRGEWTFEIEGLQLPVLVV